MFRPKWSFINQSLEDGQVLDPDDEEESGDGDGVEEQQDVCGDGSPFQTFSQK
jgi:hypothetical protein